MTTQELINLTSTLPYSYGNVKAVHDRLPVKFQNEEYIRKAFNSGFAFAFADILHHSEYEKQKQSTAEFLIYLKNMPMPKPTLVSRWRSFWFYVGYKLKLIS